MNGNRYTEDGTICLTDVCRGMVTCLAMLKRELGRYDYQPIPKRHVRRIAAREAEMKPMRDLYQRMDAELRRMQNAGVEKHD